MVKGRFMKKFLMCALTLSLMMSSAMAVSASSMGGNSTMGPASSGSQSSSGSHSSSSHSSSSHSSSSKSSGGSSASGQTAASTSKVTVGGQAINSTVSGRFYAPNVNGAAVVSQKAEVNAALGLKNGETASVRVFQSAYGPKAQKCVADTAAALNVTLGPVLDINLGKIDAGGKYSNVQHLNTAVAFTIGIPAEFVQAGSSYYVINVQPGGAVALLQDLDTDPSTLTFATTDFGVFALVRQ